MHHAALSPTALPTRDALREFARSQRAGSGSRENGTGNGNTGCIVTSAPILARVTASLNRSADTSAATPIAATARGCSGPCDRSCPAAIARSRTTTGGADACLGRPAQPVLARADRRGGDTPQRRRLWIRHAGTATRLERTRPLPSSSRSTNQCRMARSKHRRMDPARTRRWRHKRCRIPHQSGRPGRQPSTV